MTGLKIASRAPVELKFRDMRRNSLELKLLCDFFRSNGWSADDELLEWKYFNHPLEKVYISFATDTVIGGEKVAASYGVVPQVFKTAENTSVAALSLDTLTGTEYRRMGLFTKLAEMVYGRCEKEGVALVYGFPNMNSAPGFFNRLGWSCLGPTPMLFKPIRIGFLCRQVKILNFLEPYFSKITLHRSKGPRLDPSQNIVSIKFFEDEQFDDLWDRFSSQFVLAAERKRDYLNWRFCENPHSNYSTLALYENGQLMGYVTYCLLEKRGIRFGCIMELVYDPEKHLIGRLLLEHAVDSISSQGGEIILAVNYAHSPNHKAFKNTGFIYMPNFIRPVKTVFGVRKFKSCGDITIDRLSNWYISSCDFDTL